MNSIFIFLFSAQHVSTLWPWSHAGIDWKDFQQTSQKVSEVCPNTNSRCSQKSKSERHGLTTEVYEIVLKELPLRGMTVPLLLVFEPLLAEISLLLVNSASSSFSRAGQAPRTWRHLAALLVGKVVLVDLDRRPSFLVTKTVLMATTSSRLASRWWVALCRLLDSHMLGR